MQLRPPRNLLSKSSKPTAGFTLIEVLVAVLVLSLGVLGAAGMQVASLKANREARAQEVGTRLAMELAELIRSNHILAAGITTATNPYLLSFSGTAPTNSSTCFTGASCATTLDIAKRDVDDWTQRAALLLPGIVVSVCYDSSPFDASGLPDWSCDNTGNTIQIRIGWARSSLNRSTNTLDQAGTPAVVLAVTPRGA